MLWILWIFICFFVPALWWVTAAAFVFVVCCPTRPIVKWLQRHDVIYFVETTERKIALTFDDGPDPQKTPKLLAVLAKYGARASFFVNGERLARYPELAQRIVDEGHLLCNHHWRDERTVSLGEEDMEDGLVKTQALIDKFQTAPRFFRPGVGFYDNVVQRVTARHQHTLVLGDVYPHDVVFGYVPSLVALYIKARMQPGSIIILHDKSRLPTEVTVELLLRSNQYACVTLAELLSQ